MLKSKTELSDKIKRKLVANVADKSFLQDSMKVLGNKYNIPISISNDILTLKTNLEDYNDFIVYCVTDVVESKFIPLFYTDIEIERYSKEKFKKTKVKFPIVIDMCQVADDQWIGMISVKQLMTFRDAQLIRYNENAQRSMTRVVSGDKEYYVISLNKSAVKGIMNSYENGTYIANTITLNIPEDADFIYSKENHQIIIKSISSFDILDGYHRYVAMSKMCSIDKNFDYNMELRLVSFPEERARQFIWQEDQKTKMKKVDSESYNQNNYANQIVDMLNKSCGPLTGLINHGKGIMDSSVLAKSINSIYFGVSNKSYNRSEIITIKNKIRDYLIEYIDSNPTALDGRMDNKFLITLIACIKFGCIDKVESIYNTKTKGLPLAKYNNVEMNRFRKAVESECITIES